MHSGHYSLAAPSVQNAKRARFINARIWMPVVVMFAALACSADETTAAPVRPFSAAIEYEVSVSYDREGHVSDCKFVKFISSVSHRTAVHDPQSLCSREVALALEEPNISNAGKTIAIRRFYGMTID